MLIICGCLLQYSDHVCFNGRVIIIFVNCIKIKKDNNYTNNEYINILLDYSFMVIYKQ